MKCFEKTSFNDLKMCVDPIEVLHIQDAMKMIQEPKELGFDIPLCIKTIIKVKKMLDLKRS
jgi:uncharacterized protein (UPF0335 family)